MSLKDTKGAMPGIGCAYRMSFTTPAYVKDQEVLVKDKEQGYLIF